MYINSSRKDTRAYHALVVGNWQMPPNENLRPITLAPCDASTSQSEKTSRVLSKQEMHTFHSNLSKNYPIWDSQSTFHTDGEDDKARRIQISLSLTDIALMDFAAKEFSSRRIPLSQ